MAPQAAAFDLSTAFLDLPKTLAYGLVRGAGNLILQQELADKSRVAFYMLGEGPWDSILRLWINNKQVALPSSATVHFHPGLDGEIGNGLTANSTGGDQHVDQFFTLIPGGLDPITFSRHAWLALKVAPDPGAPSATLTVLADYQAMQVRQFDSSGNQTAFAWTQNWAWIICDFLIRKFVLREGKINQPLVAAELARFDWASFSAAATYYNAVLGGGQKRFSDGGVVYLNDTNTADRALEQMLLMCRSYILERNGKLSLYADQPRASVFTFTSDNVAPLSSRIVPSASTATSSGGKITFKGRKSNLRAAQNRLLPTYRDLNIATGSTDDATRFAITSNPTLDHEAHQRSVGARGPGLSVLPKVTELALDLGVNTPERVWRILKGMLVRQLGDDVDANTAYKAPFTADWTGYEDSLAVEPGDVVTIDKSLGEEFGGKLVEILQVEEVPDGTRNFTGLEYMPNAFPDVAPAQQALQAPIPGTGLTPAVTVDANGNLISIELISDNLIKNGDFNNGAQNWNRPASEFLTGVAGLPRGSSEYKSPASTVTLLSNEAVPVDIAKTYLVECWFKIGAPSTGTFYGGFAELDANKALISHVPAGSAYGYALFSGITTTLLNGWQYFAAEISGSSLTPTPTQFNSGAKYILGLFLFNAAGAAVQGEVLGYRFSEVAAGVDPRGVYIRTPVVTGSTIIMDNPNFEVSASILPPPGWTDVAGVSSYDTSTPYSGLRSLVFTTSSSGGGCLSVRKYAVRAGDVWRISGRAKLVSGAASLAYISVNFFNGAGVSVGIVFAATASAAWTLVSGAAIAPAGAVYAQIACGCTGAAVAVGEYDEIHVGRVQTSSEVSAINTSAGPTVLGTALSQAGATKTINVASKTFQFGDGPVTYNAGSTTPPAFGTYYVVADDPGLAGGAVTYLWTPQESDAYASNYRLYFGVITTVAPGGAVGGPGIGAGGGRGRLQ